MRRVIDDDLKLVAWGIAILFAAVPAIFFLSLAAFTWMQQDYGTVNAALFLGLCFLLVAVLIFVVAFVVRYRSIKRQEHEQEWWANPAVIATGLELLRIVGVRRIVPAVALSAVILGALQDSRSVRTSGRESRS